MPKRLLFFLLVSFCTVARAQTWEVGGGAGGAGYIGDLNTNPIKPSGFSGGLFFKRNFNGYLAARLNLAAGQISGYDNKSNDQQQRDRNLSFFSPLKEASLVAEFNFMKYIPDAGKNKYTPYIFVGAGVTDYTPRTKYKGGTYSLRDIMTEGQSSPYKKSAIVVPYGAGFKYNFAGKWTVGAELGYRYTNTDYLDDVSGVYPDRNKLITAPQIVLSDRSGENTGVFTGSPGSQRGDFKAHDTYMFGWFTLSYTFVTPKCYYQN